MPGLSSLERGTHLGAHVLYRLGQCESTPTRPLYRHGQRPPTPREGLSTPIGNSASIGYTFTISGRRGNPVPNGNATGAWDPPVPFCAQARQSCTETERALRILLNYCSIPKLELPMEYSVPSSAPSFPSCVSLPLRREILVPWAPSLPKELLDRTSPSNLILQYRWNKIEGWGPG